MSESASDRILEIWAALPQEVARRVELLDVSDQELADLHRPITSERSHHDNGFAIMSDAG